MIHTTSSRIGVLVTPDHLELLPGGRAAVALTVTNHGSVVDQFVLSIDDLEPGWYTLDVAEVSLFPGTSSALSFQLHLPDEASLPAGQHVARLRIISRDAPADPALVELPIVVQTVGSLTATVVPHTRRSLRSARFGLQLTNASNAEQIVDLKATDQDELLTTALELDRVAVGPGAVADTAFSVRARRRFSMIERRYPFTITLLPARTLEPGEAVEPLGTSDGEFVQRALLPFLSTPLQWRRLAMAAAGLAAAAALLIWFLAEPGRRGPLIERAPVLKPAVAALETAFNLPEPVAGGGSPSAAAARPVITRFELQSGGGAFALVFDVQDAEQVSIDGQPQPNSTSGSFNLPALAEGEHILTATNTAGTTARSLGIVVLKPPAIDALEATTAGPTTTLRWRTRGAERVSLNGEPVATDGSLEVRPTQNTLYTLLVENELGRAERQLQVNARP